MRFRRWIFYLNNIVRITWGDELSGRAMPAGISKQEDISGYVNVHHVTVYTACSCPMVSSGDRQALLFTSLKNISQPQIASNAP